MTAWRRLYVTVEGYTELEFVKELLVPHLAGRALDVRARVVTTNRKLGARGGVVSFQQVRDDIARLMREDGAAETRFTTMIDLYALPDTFPGVEVRGTPLQRVRAIESAWVAMHDDPRFLPYVQLHEFEALLFCDLDALELRLEGSSAGFTALKRQVAGLAPEDIDDGPTTAPSRRIVDLVPTYKRAKRRVGARAAIDIGLPKLRAKCPHFGDWVTMLEKLGTPIDSLVS
jgi:hypothetical protein